VLWLVDKITQKTLENLRSSNRELQNQAFFALLAATEQTVDWSYEAWDDLVRDLKHPDNHVRAIAAQVLCNLVKSDPENRMLIDFPALLIVTRDKRFVTARHCLQALWKVGVVGKAQKDMLVNGLTDRFADCAVEKNCTLIRYDILQGFRNLYDLLKDEEIRTKALGLIETEPDPKYRKKYSSLWRF
jgi:hypothetical protein